MHGGSLSAKPRLLRPRGFQARELAAVGVNLCLGTDSLASTRKQRGMNPELSLYDEMRVFADNHPDFSPEEILPMATIHGALALRRANQIGEIAGRALADLQTIPYSGPLEAATQFVVHETIHSSRVMIGGHWVNPLSAAAQ